jgi:predicted O-linked N-acetylglucosamine transferase (SPINDLY family)
MTNPENNYEKRVEFYERAVETEPDLQSHYWHLGLAYLLQGLEEEAQSIWLSALAQDADNDTEELLEELVNILEEESQYQESLANKDLAWLIRGHIAQIAPYLINNILKLINLDIDLKRFTPENLTDWQITELLRTTEPKNTDFNLLLELLGKILTFPSLESVNFCETCLEIFPQTEILIAKINSLAIKMGYEERFLIYSADLTKLCIKKQPRNISMIRELFWYYMGAEHYDDALESTEKFCALCQTTASKFQCSYQRLFVSIRRSDWLSIRVFAQEYKNLLCQVAEQKSEIIENYIVRDIITSTTPLLYLQDCPGENRYLINKISQIFLKWFQSTSSCPVSFPQILRKNRKEIKKLKIGYISHTLNSHSVGWLSRWLFHHHDRESFYVAVYLIGQSHEDEITNKWFRNNADVIYNLQTNVQGVVTQIEKDEIDILVDLDSQSHNLTCHVMAQKPASVQVTWLGMDASGLSTIDYFIADPYVLPENAQEYYQEKIWRLPHTYLAVDGFEVDVPTLRRESLDIPQDAVIYLNIQSALKRNPHTICLQMQILKLVPNSYLLIKGTGDEKITQNFFTRLAEEEGVDSQRLRFLGRDENELIHRANLQIADVVLDTYPYNGATTTLEVLWMGIPVVTRVGEQFAARNSYAFMTNAGITEGIAWTDEEYVEWAVKLGTDKTLHQQVAWKLRESRKTSTLWNGEQFTREMEKAYQQMWEIYCQQ